MKSGSARISAFSLTKLSGPESMLGLRAGLYSDEELSDSYNC